MKTWAKYLVIGWSIICIGVILLSFQIMKDDFIKQDYDIYLPLKVPEKINDNFEFIGSSLYHNDEKFLSKEEFIKRVKGIKSIELQSDYKVNKAIYLVLPIYAFMVWALPILMFALLGNLFGKNKTTPYKTES